MTQQQTTINKEKTAVVIMDFQNRIVNNYASDPQGVVKRAAQVLQGARQVGIPIFYVVHRGRGFEPNPPDTDIHPGVAVAPGEPVLAKIRTSPFSTTGLDVMLREMGKDTLVMMGVSTSGCVLTAVKWANDINYKTIVVSDACSDLDAEVHRVLTEKIYARQGGVMTVQQFLKAVGVA